MGDMPSPYYDITAFRYSWDGTNNFIRDKADKLDTTARGDRHVYDKTSTLLYGDKMCEKSDKCAGTVSDKVIQKRTMEGFANVQNETLKLSIPIWLLVLLVIIYFVMF